MDRRTFLSTAAAAAATSQARAELPLRQAARDMALYGLPLVETAGARARTLSLTPPNRFRHARQLTTPKSQGVTQPNNDTLYSTAWIDLAGGPARIVLPATGGRYMSLALMDTFTDNFAVLGLRTTGGEGGEFTLVGPDAPLPNPGAIRSPTRWVWALARFLVDGDDDLPNVHKLQEGLRLEAGAAGPPTSHPGRAAAWDGYFTGLQALLKESPPPATDLAVFERSAALGLGQGRGFDPSRFSADQAREIAAGVAEALALAKGAAGSNLRRGDWVFPRPNLGDFRQDYLYRAQIALNGLAALPVDEATYLWPVNAQGTVEIDSRRRWRLSFPPNQLPPVDAFWSLTAYQTTPEGQAFLFENPINRYSIGDRTRGLVRGRDGSLDIWISAEDPGPARRSNWLPAPASGKPLQMTLRAYLPRSELNTGAYVPPSLKAV